MYIKLTNGIPAKYTLEDLKRDNPQTSFPKNASDDTLASYDIYTYTRPVKPMHDFRTSKLIEGNFEKDSTGKWSLPYVVEQHPLYQAELNIRSYRDRLLRETDWIVILHFEKGIDVSIELKIYRQTLRDIPLQPNFPYLVDWPTKPKEVLK